uniref:Uncharacterized protein n=1 Tax=Meloidogyne enterolobii TaxID=390850 RepID=A0A6V7V6Q8_MELEN|nr:unnamed protein product [Meloidogyne enterolobii]
MLIKYYFIGIFILQIVTLINSERLPFWQRARDQILNKVQNTNLEDFKFNDLFDLSEEKQEILQEENEGYDTDYTYKSICFIDGKPMVVNNLDCRYQGKFVKIILNFVKF